MSWIDDLLGASALISTMPPAPLRVRVTTAMHDALKARVAVAVAAPPVTPPGSLYGVPVVVDDTLPDSPGWTIDYARQS